MEAKKTKIGSQFLQIMNSSVMAIACAQHYVLWKAS